MTLIAPASLTTAAADLEALGATVTDAHTAARAATTGITMAGDEVSTAVTALFNGHAQQWQQAAAATAQFHQQFTQTLTQAAAAYESTDEAAQQALRNQVTSMEGPVGTLLEQTMQTYPPAPGSIVPITVPTGSTVGLVVGGTSNPFSTWMLPIVKSLYNLPANSSLVYTPEQFWPVTPQFGPLTLGQSISQGTALLNTAISAELAAGNHVTAWGTSQSSVILTDEIRNLMAAGSPGTDRLSFILTGDPNNPNGGILERFTGAYIPFLDILFNGATPPNSPYPTSIYTNQYDAVGDFPQYPLNLLADLNAGMGSFTGQHDYTVAHDYYPLPTSPGYTGDTTYYMSLDPTLPLLQPLRGSTAGNAVADLLQPDLRVIVDMGYGTGEYANMPTPAQLFAVPNPSVVLPDLARGAVQGVQAFGVDLGLLPHSDFPTTYPYAPSASPDLNYPTGQPAVTGISVLTGAEGALMGDLGLVPSWDVS